MGQFDTTSLCISPPLHASMSPHAPAHTQTDTYIKGPVLPGGLFVDQSRYTELTHTHWITLCASPQSPAKSGRSALPCACLYNDAKSDLFDLSAFFVTVFRTFICFLSSQLAHPRCSLFWMSHTAQTLENSVLCDNGAHKLTCLCENSSCLES